jgi:hypothetical protein
VRWNEASLKNRSSQRALAAWLRVLAETQRTLDAFQSERQGVRSALAGTESVPAVAGFGESEDDRALREMFTSARIMRDAPESCKWAERRMRQRQQRIADRPAQFDSAVPERGSVFPCSCHQVQTPVRFSTPSFLIRFSTCFFTVGVLRSKILAISSFRLPRPIQLATSSSRGVNRSSPIETAESEAGLGAREAARMVWGDMRDDLY